MQSKALGLLGILFIGALLFGYILFLPDVRAWVSSQIYPSERVVLSLLNTNIADQDIKVLKVRFLNKIYLEVYHMAEAGEELVERTILTDAKDASYKMEDGSSNLFAKDIDGDGHPEIIAPSFDKNMIAHLNIYQYEPNSKKLVKLSQH